MIKTKPKRKKIKHEEREQRALIQWAKLHPYIYDYMIVSMSGGSRHTLEAYNLKRLGSQPGIPDIFIAFPTEHYHGLFIELKRREGGRLSTSQIRWLLRLKERGYATVKACGWEQAVYYIKNYLNGSLNENP